MSTTETPVREPQQPIPVELRNEPLFADGVSWPPATKSYLEEFVRTLQPTQAFLEAMVARIAWPVGQPRLIFEDLTAETGEYVWTDPITGLKGLYLNGVAGGVSQVTYAALYAAWGPNKWGADPGSNFLLPDTRGRELVLCGTHVDCDLGDTFGPATES